MGNTVSVGGWQEQKDVGGAPIYFPSLRLDLKNAYSPFGAPIFSSLSRRRRRYAVEMMAAAVREKKKCPGGALCTLKQNVAYINRMLDRQRLPLLLLENPNVPGSYVLAHAELFTTELRHYGTNFNKKYRERIAWLIEILSRHDACVEPFSLESPIDWSWYLTQDFKGKRYSVVHIELALTITDFREYLRRELLRSHDAASLERLTRLEIIPLYAGHTMHSCLLRAWLSEVLLLVPNLRSLTVNVGIDTLQANGIMTGSDGSEILHYIRPELTKLFVERHDSYSGTIQASYTLGVWEGQTEMILCVKRTSADICMNNDDDHVDDVFSLCTSLRSVSIKDVQWISHDRLSKREYIRTQFWYPIIYDEGEEEIEEEEEDDDDECDMENVVRPREYVMDWLHESDTMDSECTEDVPPSGDDSLYSYCDHSDGDGSCGEPFCHLNWLWEQLFEFLAHNSSCVIERLDCVFCIACHRLGNVKLYMDSLALNRTVRVLENPKMFCDRDCNAFLRLLCKNRSIEAVEELQLGMTVYKTERRIQRLAYVLKNHAFNLVALSFSGKVTFRNSCYTHYRTIVRKVSQNSSFLNRVNEWLQQKKIPDDEEQIPSIGKMGPTRSANVLRLASSLNRDRLVKRFGESDARRILAEVDSSFLWLSGIVQNEAQEKSALTLWPLEAWSKIFSHLNLQDVSPEAVRIARDSLA